MGERTYRTVLIGSGNVATLLSQRIDRKTFPLIAAGGRRRFVDPLPKDADLYIIAVSDRAIAAVAEELKEVTGLVVHTAGSVPMDVLPQARRGVLYPLQTVSKGADLARLEVPLFIEAERDEDMELLRTLALTISPTVTVLSSEKRRKLHLAAVFANNFVNRLYGIASDMLRKEGLPFELLLPLIRETADKVSKLSPSEAQTGPALRWDTEVMERQEAMLGDDDLRALYRIMCKQIHDDKLRLNEDQGTHL